MTFAPLYSGTDVFDNLTGSSPLDWNTLLRLDYVVPQGAWFGTGQLQMELQVFYSVTTNVQVAKSGTERFLNPPQAQFGHWAAISNGFVVNDGRLLYERQIHSYKSSQVQVSATQADARQNFGNTLESRASHAVSLTEFNGCVEVTGLATPPPTPSKFLGQANFGAGALCLGIHFGQIELQEKDPFLPGKKEVVLRAKDLMLPDELSGVLWTGHRLEVGWILGTQEVRSSANPVAPYSFLTGPLSVPNYQYSCALGNPVPLPINPPCQPLQLDLSVIGSTGQVVLGCNFTQP